MAWNDAGEIVVGSHGTAYVAAVGATAPTAHDSSLAAATWTSLGYLTEDGITKSSDVETAEIKAWQSFHPIRREVVGRTERFSFALMQWDTDNIIVAFGGGTVEAAGTGYKYTPPQDSDALNEKALVIDVNDGSNTLRFYAPRVTIVEGVETTFKRGEAAILPITFDVLEPTSGGDSSSLFIGNSGWSTGS